MRKAIAYAICPHKSVFCRYGASVVERNATIVEGAGRALQQRMEPFGAAYHPKFRS